MAYSKNEILGFDNPYNHLNDGDVLAEHQEILDALDHDRKTILASAMVSKCPPEKLKEFGRALNALGSPMNSSQGTFHAIIFPLHQVKTRMFSLLDPENPRPHTILKDSLDLFNEHKYFALHVLINHEAALAERLAALAPEERNRTAQLLKSAFPKSPLTEKINIAFTLQRNIECLLLGAQPEQFFTSRDFSREHCLLFANLFTPIKDELAQHIGVKLAQITAAETRQKVEEGLKSLTTSAHDKANPFALIRQAMNANTLSVASNMHSSFASPAKKQEDPANAATLSTHLS
ncbi:hypothetical protein [Legionella drancourtii]|uniref:Uncharacterized protein n=1 Tax=Legionella drancourtii LLAP12 TaxID=658187 RepID=G9EJW7_9GAMM|nr:hypothetical protein [Legionella drancourtii]EHL32527.1 hypothetical protein LDG_5484 [Legionella drancourtii LLAP12]